MNWFKRLFGIGDKMETDNWGLPKVSCDIPMPKVKPLKGKNISEPVFAMLNTWKQNPKRFVHSTTYDTSVIFSITSQRSRQVNYEAIFTDKISGEVFKFYLKLKDSSVQDIWNRYWHSHKQDFASHKVYPILGYILESKPSWMTQDEAEFVIETVKPYYLNRVNRYRDIVESRIDRTRKANELKSEIAKQKERDRLTGVYQ